MPIRWKCVRVGNRTNFEVGKIYEEGRERSLDDGSYRWQAADCESAVEWLRKYVPEIEFEEVKTMYNVGDKVRIVSEWGPGCNQNLRGHMDRWLGQVMTIKAVELDSYTMVEDGGEWVWFEPAVSGLAEFQKADLRNGDVVQCRNGLQYMVMLDCGTHGKDILLNMKDSGYNLLTSYSADMKSDDEYADWDIMKVWRASIYGKALIPDNMQLVFERAAIKEISMAEAVRLLTEHFGEQVEIK